ncbi:hypothetical protein K0M31_017383 [Melipona bicolor]|uniref:Uncharacterized protein n=1 Tax=Melipona bicolor TaxID=60889 RepID=A0AA40KSD7_9HYME|nr:hypothetical protein K0M31_017383 [Melipona bicolor]
MEDDDDDDSGSKEEDNDSKEEDDKEDSADKSEENGNEDNGDVESKEESNDESSSESESSEEDDDEGGGSIKAIIELLMITAPALEDLSDPDSDADIADLLELGVPLLQDLSEVKTATKFSRGEGREFTSDEVTKGPFSGRRRERSERHSSVGASRLVATQRSELPQVSVESLPESEAEVTG